MKVRVQHLFLFTLILSFSLFSGCKKEDNNIGLKVGNIAPDFTLPDQDGNNKSLLDYRGQLVLIDFWASWCSFCRAENPELASIYTEYKDQNFEILGVSLDTDQSAWKQAIADDQLEYIHLSDLEGFNSPVATSYGISSIPTMILLDVEGKIVLITNKASDINNYLEDIFR